MDTHDLLQLFDKEQRRDIEFPDMRKDVLPNVVRFVRPAPGMSFVLYSRLDESTADAAIDEQVAYFQDLRQPFEWKVYDHDQPADLRARVAARGFECEDPDAVMVLDLQAASPALLAPVTADVRPITQREQLEDVIQVMVAVWGGNFDWIRQRLGDHLDIPGYLNVYVAYADGQPACAGWIYFHPGSRHFASLWGGSTLPEYRGRGLYTAILAARAQAALRRGCRYLTIDASPMSRPIVARHGFQLLTYAHACEWQPQDASESASTP